MIKQVILDMQNQLLQVKTQVAIAIADQHLLDKKHKENEEKSAEWVRKAELAVDKKQDDLARAALERSLSYRSLAEHFAQQVADKAGDARLAMGDAEHANAFDRMNNKVQHNEAFSQAKAELTGDSVEDRLASLERQDEVERLLAELKSKRA